MSETWNLQASYKFGERGDMLNVRGENALELNAHLASLTDGDVIQNITQLGALLNGAQTVANVPTPPAAQGGPQFVPQQPTPQPVVTGGGQGQQNAPQCPHGQRVYREGVGSRGPWRAYFCPAAKGTPGQCAPDFLRG